MQRAPNLSGARERDGSHDGDRRDLERALRQTEQRYRAVVGTQHAFVARLDPGARITFVSPAFCRLLGKSSDEMVGSLLWPLLHPDDVAAGERAFRTVVQPAYCTSMETRVATVEGWTRMDWELEGLRPAGSAVEEIQGVARDVTEWRRLEMGRYSARLQSLGTMAAALAHDMGSSLSTILMHAHLILTDARVQQRSTVRASADAIAQEARACGRMARSMLRFTADESLVTERLSVDELLRELAERVDGYVRAHGATLELALATDVPAIRGNRTELELLVMNLVRNAIKSRPSGVAVLIKATATESFLRLTVEDDGPGIAPEVKDRIFEPSVTHGQRGGTGLGLTLCREIVERYGGSIEVESAPERGTSVHVDLPVPPIPDAAP